MNALTATRDAATPTPIPWPDPPASDASEARPPLGGHTGAVPDRPVITARGTGEVRVKPDSMRVDVGANVQAAKLEDARSQVNERIFKVLSALQALSLPGLVLETQTLHFSPVYARQRAILLDEGLGEIVGYRATNRVLATLRGLSPHELSDKAASIVDTALAAGANAVGGIGFFLEAREEFERKALGLAVERAKKDAEAIATAAGVRLTGLHSMEQTSGSRYSSWSDDIGAPMAMMAAKSRSTPVEVGETTVIGSVTANYSFEAQ